jgi:hypothetical protein
MEHAHVLSRGNLNGSGECAPASPGGTRVGSAGRLRRRPAALDPVAHPMLGGIDRGEQDALALARP